jgi:hypothetical protein
LQDSTLVKKLFASVQGYLLGLLWDLGYIILPLVRKNLPGKAK